MQSVFAFIFGHAKQSAGPPPVETTRITSAGDTRVLADGDIRVTV